MTTNFNNSRHVARTLFLLISSCYLCAQASEPAEPGGAAQLPKVRVEGRGMVKSELSGPVTTLQGDELRNKAAATLGATLQDELGVANSSFGPNVGLPIIRGQGGTRVRAMVSGSGAHDASSLSADHGVMVEAGLAERITVHRGPSAIRFGGEAIGGAIEIDYGRVPEKLAKDVQGRSELRVGPGSRMALARAQGGIPLGDSTSERGIAWHVDAHRRKKTEAKIPGWAIDEDAVKRQFYLVSGRNTWGHIDNSDAHSSGGALGLSAILPEGFVGLSTAVMDSNYGIPPGAHSHKHGAAKPIEEQAEGAVRIQAKQHRSDLNGEFKLGWALAQRLKLRLADTRYQHEELNRGIAETVFRNNVQEGRLELEHGFASGHQGSLGLHLQRRQFSAQGLEAFVPPTAIRGAAFYWVERLEGPQWTAELGLRAEQRAYTPEAQKTNFGIEVALPNRDFQFGNFSLALTRKFENGSLTLTHWRASRAPEVQELYALGPHVATRSYDFGNSALDIETLRGWNLSVKQHWGDWALNASAFRYEIKDHIYQRSLGVFYSADKEQFRALCAQLDQCLPVTRYEQAHAKFQGFEAELSRELFSEAFASGDGLLLAIYADRVRGRLDRLGHDVPRQPAARWGLRLEGQSQQWQGELRMVRTLAQNHAGENETTTAGSQQWHATLRWSGQKTQGRQASVYLLARNLSNQEVRNSTSFLRNYAPEPGRSVELGAELHF